MMAGRSRSQPVKHSFLFGRGFAQQSVFVGSGDIADEFSVPLEDPEFICRSTSAGWESGDWHKSGWACLGSFDN